jgi:hypothetical protein
MTCNDELRDHALSGLEGVFNNILNMKGVGASNMLGRVELVIGFP